MAAVSLSLGSNLGNRWQMLCQAIELLEERVGKILTLSPFVETEPWGFDSAEPFLNACILLSTTLKPEELLATTAEIEKTLGRKVKSHDGQYHDREIDIDILLYDDQRVELRHLIIPHPLMHERLFVLAPLAQIIPTQILPSTGQSIAWHLNELSMRSSSKD